MTKFIIVAAQRTGSTMIRLSLDSHPSVRCFGEEFHRKRKLEQCYRSYIKKSFRRKALHYLWSRQPVSEYLDWLYEQAAYDTIGFKLLYSQANLNPWVMGYVRRHRIRVVHIVRKNVLKKLVSKIAKRSDGVSHSMQEVADRRPVHVPVRTLIFRLKRISKRDADWTRRLSALPYLKVSYEDFVSNPETPKKILDFIGVDRDQPLHSPLKKLNPDRLEDIVANYEEVRERLIGGPFAYCLS